MLVDNTLKGAEEEPAHEKSVIGMYGAWSVVSAKKGSTSRKWLPWHVQTNPKRAAITGRVTLAPMRFMSKFVGSTMRMCGTLFDN